MSSILKVDTIQDQAGNNIISEAANVITIGASGDTITVPAGATVSGFTSAGIDDNATSVAITINSSEQVGIGTASPSQPLHVYSTGNDIARIETNQTEGRLSLKDATGEAILKFRNDYRFTNSTGELARLNSSGNFGIGTSAPSATVGTDKVLEISGSVSPGLVINDTGQAEKYQLYADSTKFKMNYGSTNFLTYDASNSNLGVGTTSPSQKLEVNGNIKTSTTGSVTSGTLQGIGGAPIDIDRFELGAGFLNLDRDFASEVNQIQFGKNGTLAAAFATGQDYLVIKTNGNNERMRITSAGSVGIGTSAPQATTEIVGGTGDIKVLR